MTSARAVAAVALLIGFYVLGGVTLLFFVFLVLAELHFGIRGGALVATAISGLGFAWTFSVAVLAARRAAQVEPTGMLLPLAEQPALWATVTALAREVGTRPPDEIRLSPEVNAAVSETSRWMGLLPGRRQMLLGAPLLLGLTRGQLVAVMAHELGHFSGRHTSLTTPIYRGGHALVRVLEELGPTSKAGHVFRLYADIFFRVSLRVSRVQELEADDTAARIAGRDTMISALRELRPLRAGWELFVDGYVGPAHRQGLRPEAPAEGFLDLLDDPHRRRTLTRVRDEVDEPAPSIFDSHPPTSQRIALLQRRPDDPRPADELPGFAVLTNPDSTMKAFFDTLYDGSEGLQTRDWHQIGAVLGERTVALRANALVRSLATAPWRGGRPVNWAAVGSELRSGRGPELAGRVSDVAGTGAGQRDLASVLVAGLLARSLVEHAGAHYSLDWSGLGRVVDDEGRAYPVADVARAAVESSAGAEDLLTFATSCGIPTDQELLESTPQDSVERDTEPRAVGAVGPLQRGRTTVLALPSTVGLAIVPIRGVTAYFRVANAEQSSRAAHRLGTWLLRDGFEAMLDRPGAELLAWDDIVAAGILGRGVRRPALAIALASGHERILVVRRRWDSTDHDDPWGALRHFLGDRFTGQRQRGATGSRVGVSGP